MKLVTFVVCFGVFVFGLFLMGLAFNIDAWQAECFFAGILAISASYFIPVHMMKAFDR